MDQDKKDLPANVENEEISKEQEKVEDYLEESEQDASFDEDLPDEFEEDDLSSMEDDWQDIDHDNDTMESYEDQADEDFSQAPVQTKKPFDVASFLKNNFHYIAIAVVVVFVLSLIVDTFTKNLPQQQNTARQEQPAVEYNADAGQQANPFGDFNNTADPFASDYNNAQNQSAANGNNADAGLLLGEDPLLSDQSTPSDRVNESSPADWQKPPMPAPISPDVGDVRERILASQEVLKSPPPEVDQESIQRIPATGSQTSDSVLDGTERSEKFVDENLVDETVLITEDPATTSVIENDTATVDNEEVSVSEASQAVTTVQEVDLTPVYNRLDQVETQFQTILQRLEQLDIALSEQRIGSAATKETTADVDLSSIEKSLEGLSKKVDRVTSRLSKLEKAESAAPIKTPAPKAKVTQEAKPELKKPAPPQHNWVLRAAQPNIAWLSDGPNAPIQKVTVGQTIKGIGLVQSVRVEQGRWVVRGSLGNIYQ